MEVSRWVAWDKADRERARNAMRRPSVCRPTTNKPASFATRRRKMQRQLSAGRPLSTNDGKDWEWGRAGARVAVRRLPPSGLHPSCGCGLETWFVVIGRAGAMGGRFWYHNPPGAGAEDKAKPEWKKGLLGRLAMCCVWLARAITTPTAHPLSGRLSGFCWFFARGNWPSVPGWAYRGARA